MDIALYCLNIKLAYAKKISALGYFMRVQYEEFPRILRTREGETEVIKNPRFCPADKVFSSSKKSFICYSSGTTIGVGNTIGSSIFSSAC